MDAVLERGGAGGWSRLGRRELHYTEARATVQERSRRTVATAHTHARTQDHAQDAHRVGVGFPPGRKL